MKGRKRKKSREGSRPSRERRGRRVKEVEHVSLYIKTLSLLLSLVSRVPACACVRARIRVCARVKGERGNKSGCRGSYPVNLGSLGQREPSRS